MKKASKPGEVHITNDELSGMHVLVTHVGGGKFKASLMFPEHVAEQVPFGKEGIDAGQYTGESLLGVGYELLQAFAFQEDCVEVSIQGKAVVDARGYNAKQMLEDAVEKVGRSAFEDEKARGLVPDDMSYEQWLEISDVPDKGSLH